MCKTRFPHRRSVLLFAYIRVEILKYFVLRCDCQLLNIVTYFTSFFVSYESFFPLQECFQTSSKYLSQETFKSNLLFEKNLGNVIILIYYKVDIYLFIYLLGN